MDIGFSQRLQNIVTISNSLIAHGSNVTDARDEAKRQEEEILRQSTTVDEYQKLVDEFSIIPEKQSSPNEPQALIVDEAFNPDGPVFANGKYTESTFHAQGQMSTISKAREATSSTTEIVALKVTQPSQMQPPHNSEREARILTYARDSTHVVPLLDSFWQSGGRFVLVFPFLRQDLENLLRSNSLTHAQSRMIFTGLFSALQHVHSLGIIHRDVKPSNILLQTMQGPVYLTDFGIAWSPDDPESEPTTSKITDVGTTCYRPPELLFGDRAYDTSLDMWAAGCTIAEVVRKGHYQLFDAGPVGSELGLIKSIFMTLGTPDNESWPSAQKYPDWGKVNFQVFPARPWPEILVGALRSAVDFVQKTVCYEPTARLTAAQALEHALAQDMQLINKLFYDCYSLLHPLDQTECEHLHIDTESMRAWTQPIPRVFRPVYENRTQQHGMLFDLDGASS